MYKKYTLKQPAARSGRIGAFYAAILPCLIGLMVLSGVVRQEFDFDKALNLPLALAFIVGTPVCAWLTQDAVRQRPSVTYWEIFEIGLLRATILQTFFGLVFLIYYGIILGEESTLRDLFSTGLLVQTILWAIVTLPLSMVCAVIFKLSAMRPVYG